MNDVDLSALAACLGKRLTAYSQSPNAGNFARGDWRDDEPLILTFEDGVEIEVCAFGWHNSGGLEVRAKPI